MEDVNGIEPARHVSPQEGNTLALIQDLRQNPELLSELWHEFVILHPEEAASIRALANVATGGDTSKKEVYLHSFIADRELARRIQEGIELDHMLEP